MSDSETIEGLTNLIMVDRHNILKTAVDEIQSLEDLRSCLEVVLWRGQVFMLPLFRCLKAFIEFLRNVDKIRMSHKEI